MLGCKNMKKLLVLLGVNLSLATCYALGPTEISFNGERFYKSNEKQQNSAIIAEYLPNGNSSNSIILTHVLNKNDPSKIAQGLKTKKSIEVVDIESLNTDRTDMLVSFVKFDTSNSKVQNNICRIIRNDKGGSFVFQYVDTKRLKGQGEGTTLPDFTQLSELMKQVPVDKYSHATNSLPAQSYSHSYGSRTERSNIPWHKRQNARMGKGAYPGYNQKASYRYHYRYRYR